MKNNNSSRRVIGRLLIKIRDLFQGLCNFILGSINLVRLFIEANIESICVALVIFAALLLAHVSIYFSILVASGYFVYQVREWINSEIAEFNQPEVQEAHVGKLEALKAIPGFNAPEGKHPAEVCETLSRKVFNWFVEDADHDLSIVFVERLRRLGYTTPPENIIGPMQHGIQTTIAVNEENKDILVSTAGTDFEAGTTLIEDLDHSGPGRQAFSANRDIIINPIVATAEKMDYINISGHSFGGAISMMILVELLKEIKEGRLDVKGINLFVYQSAGVNDEVALEAKTLLAELKETHPGFSVNMVAHFHDFDPVHGSGIQILSDYEGENAKVFAIRRHLSSWALLNFVAKPFSVVDRAHLGSIYDHAGQVDQYDYETKKIMSHSVYQVYHNAEYDAQDKDRKEIQSLFQSTHTKFMCNETMYRFFGRYDAKVWKIALVGLFVVACVLTLSVNFLLLIYVPNLVTFQNFFNSLAPTLGAWAYFEACLDQYQAPSLVSQLSSEEIEATGDVLVFSDNEALVPAVVSSELQAQ